MLRIFFYVCLLILVQTDNLFAQSDIEKATDVPISTQWVLDAAGPTGRAAINSVFLIFCPKTQKKGTGFLLKSGVIITCEHVVDGCQAGEIVAFSSFGKNIYFKELLLDSNKDLAILKPTASLDGGLKLGDDSKIQVGQSIATWGFPLGYNGPAPLLSVGYLAGFNSYINNSILVKHLIVNGAFNPGNSGGPLFIANDNNVIGIVVSKHAPISEFQLGAIKAMAGNKYGMMYEAKDSEGKTISFSEAQLVADLLDYFRSMTQVMIGEAISVEELKIFLKENKIPF